MQSFIPMRSDCNQYPQPYCKRGPMGVSSRIQHRIAQRFLAAVAGVDRLLGGRGNSLYPSAMDPGMRLRCTGIKPYSKRLMPRHANMGWGAEQWSWRASSYFSQMTLRSIASHVSALAR